MPKVQTKLNFPEKKKFRLAKKLETNDEKSHVILSPTKSHKFSSPTKSNEFLSPSEIAQLVNECLDSDIKQLKSVLKSPLKEVNSPVKCGPIIENVNSTCSDSMRKKCNSSSDTENVFCENKRTPVKKRLYSSDSPLKIKNDDGISPSKQKCRTETTPNSLVKKLTLDSPSSTEKHHASSRELFPAEFHEACRALHSSAPTNLPGREDMLKKMKDFFLKHLEKEKSGTLYVSGPPGTGKTACLHIAVSDPQISKGYKVVYINCTSMKSSSAVYMKIVEKLGLKISGSCEKSSLSAIEKCILSSKNMILLVLDELDELSNRKQSILYTVFEWPSMKNSRVVLVGIANALDLTDRVLPRLQARLDIQPTLMHFSPYTRQQIIDIITDRLKQARVCDILSGSALQLLAGKVAAVSGDVRRALDIARRVIELAESKSVLSAATDTGARKDSVGLEEVLTVVNDVYNTAQSLHDSNSDNFPLQQKLLICSLLLVLKHSKSKDVTVGKLHEVYKRVCEKRNLTALDLSEFLSLANLVSTRGILRVVGKNYNRLSKVTLQWDEKEISNALQDKKLLSSVLNDSSCVR